MLSAASIVAAIRSGEITAARIVEETLARIAGHDPKVNAFTAVTAQRARKEAADIDRLRSRAVQLPPLAGVPYAVKNLFDVKGLTTLAGSKLNTECAPAQTDAVVIERMRAAGAVLVGTLNMDAYAYGFTTENTAYGPTRNPHDSARTSGGSSGGSAAALAAGMVPLALGSDTNGSIRVPASLCGVFALKPTFGRLPRTGSYPFVASLDHVGPFATNVSDLARCYDLLQGVDARDRACAQREVEPVSPGLERGMKGLRVARLTGWFDEYSTPAARQASEVAARALGADEWVELPEVERARAAAFLITGAEAGALHLGALRARYADMEPHARDRLLAGALSPGAWYVQAQRLRAWFRDRAHELLARFDLLVAPATPCSATPLGTEWLEINGRRLPLRPSLGLLTQPISCIGLPVAVAPIAIAGALPIGVQLISAPWREDVCVRAAALLERDGVARCRLAVA